MSGTGSPRYTCKSAVRLHVVLKILQLQVHDTFSLLCAYAQNEFVGSYKHAAMKEMSESEVNAAMYVRFEANSDLVSAARIAIGGILSPAAAAYDLTEMLAGRLVVAVA